MTRRLLAVHAHPDDESSKGAATDAYYAAAAPRCMVVSCTGGERGDILNDASRASVAMAERDMAGLRRLEMAAAQADASASSTAGSASSTPACPRTASRLAAGSFARIPLEISAEPLVRLVRDVPPARDRHLRRERRLPASRPHPRPRASAMRRVACRGRSRRVSGCGRALVDQQVLLRPHLQLRARPTPCDEALREAAPDVAARRARWTRCERWMRDAGPMPPRTSSAGEFFDPRDAGAARPRQPGRPRQSASSSGRTTCSARPGRTRTSSSSHSRSRRTMPETDLFAGITELTG